MAPFSGFLRRLRSWVDSSVPVHLVCEVAAEHVAAVRYDSGGVQAWAVSPLNFSALMDKYPKVARALLPVLTARIRSIEAAQ